MVVRRNAVISNPNNRLTKYEPWKSKVAVNMIIMQNGA